MPPPALLAASRGLAADVAASLPSASQVMRRAVIMTTQRWCLEVAGGRLEVASEVAGSVAVPCLPHTSSALLPSCQQQGSQRLPQPRAPPTRQEQRHPLLGQQSVHIGRLLQAQAQAALQHVNHLVDQALARVQQLVGAPAAAGKGGRGGEAGLSRRWARVRRRVGAPAAAGDGGRGRVLDGQVCWHAGGHGVAGATTAGGVVWGEGWVAWPGA